MYTALKQQENSYPLYFSQRKTPQILTVLRYLRSFSSKNYLIYFSFRPLAESHTERFTIDVLSVLNKRQVWQNLLTCRIKLYFFSNYQILQILIFAKLIFLILNQQENSHSLREDSHFIVFAQNDLQGIFKWLMRIV